MFYKINPRFNSAPIDDNRSHGLIALSSTTQTSNSQALSISGFYLAGIGALATAVVDTNGVQITSFGSGATTDGFPATQNITVIDSSSATASGANGQSIVIGTPTAGSAASFALAGYATIRVEVTGIWTGTIVSEISIDGGITWTSLGLHQGAYTTSSFTGGFIGGGNVSGVTNYRMRATAAMTGTAVVKVTESINLQSVYIANAAPSGNVISTANSSTATLISGAVFTGVSEDVSNFSEMRVSVFSDVASATDGLSIQQSTNNINWDITDTYTIAAATGNNLAALVLAINNGTSTSTSTINTTTTNVFDVTVTWSNNTNGNSVSSLNCVLEGLN